MDHDDPLVRRMTRAEMNDVLDAEDRSTLMYRLVTELETPYRSETGVLVCRYADVHEVNRHPLVTMGDPDGGGYKDMGADHPLGPHSRDGEEHRRFRKLLDPIFSPRRMAAMTDDVRALANELVDGFVDDGRVEFHDRFAVPLPCLIFLRILGVPAEQLGTLIAFKDGIIRSGGRTVEEHRARAYEGGLRLRAWFRDYLDERQKHPLGRWNLIDDLLSAEEDGERLTREEVIDICQLFTIAGLDTVTSSLSCVVSWLARHPVERERVAKDPAVIPHVIEELLRYESPVVAGTRYALADIEINGFPVRAGEELHVIWGTANVDPEQFEDPLTVDFDRSPNRHMAFASGPHRCIGSHLARLEMCTALEEWHRRIPDYSLDPDDPPVYTDVGVRAATRLPLRFPTP